MIINKKLENIGNKILQKADLPKDIDKSGSIILIIMIISAVLTLIRIMQECNKKKLINLSRPEKAKIMQSEIKNVCIKNTLLNRLRLSRIIKQNLSKEEYKLYGDKIKNAIMDVGSQLTDEESLTLVEAANV
jgi:hypothetical protein